MVARVSARGFARGQCHVKRIANASLQKPTAQRARDDAGFKTDSGGLQFSLRDQSSSGQNSGNDSGRNAQRLVISEGDSIPATAMRDVYGGMLGSSSGDDIKV